MTTDQYNKICKYIKDGKTIQIHIKDTTAQFKTEEEVISFKINGDTITAFYGSHMLEDKFELKEIFDLLSKINNLRFYEYYDYYTDKDVIIITEYEERYCEFYENYYFEEYITDIQNVEIKNDIKQGYFKEKLINSIKRGGELILINTDKNNKCNYIAIKNNLGKTEIESDLELHNVDDVIDYIYKLDINEQNTNYVYSCYSQIKIDICDPYIKKQLEEKQKEFEKYLSLPIEEQLKFLAESTF